MARIKSDLKCLVKSLLLCVCVLSVFVRGQNEDTDSCRTPTGEVSSCIPIRQCKTILDYLSNARKPISESVKQKLNTYTCGYDTTSVKVCCPGSIDIDNSGGDKTPQPPDVSNHRNFNLLPEDCGYIPLDDKIVNGQRASLNEFPWMALLSYRTASGPKFKCGGSIINEKWILTAAHCVSNLKEPLLGVRVGEHDILTKVDCEIQQDGSNKCGQPVQDLFIEEVIPHPDFNLNVIANDIALVKVGKINFNSENIRPVCLPVGDARNMKFSNAFVTGWGTTETGRASNVLLKVSVPVINPEQCRSAYTGSARVRVTEKQICAGGKNKKDSCSGDSGGPLQVANFINGETRYVQAGVVSFGPMDCGLEREGFPGVYTNIAYYMDWILDNITP